MSLGPPAAARGESHRLLLKCASAVFTCVGGWGEVAGPIVRGSVSPLQEILYPGKFLNTCVNAKGIEVNVYSTRAANGVTK